MSVTLEGVSHGFGGRRILANVDLAVGPGTSVAIMGPSGVGKTTLISIMGLLIRPDAGRVLIAGDEVGRRESVRHRERSRTFGWVLQTVNVLGRRSALHNVAVPLLASGMPAKKAYGRAHAALDSVGLGDRADVSARFLSGGEAQRVCIARALAPRPAVLLADEPSGQLDQATSARILDDLFSLRAQAGTTLVIVTHDSDVARRCQQVLHLVNGGLEPS